MSRANLYKLGNTVIASIIGIIACYYLYQLSVDKLSALEMDSIFRRLKQNILYFVIAIILMPINWLIETHKWRSLITNLQSISFIQSLESIVFGVSLSLMTPNRLGELGGRLLYLKKENRKAALFVNTFCSYSQLLMTIIGGLIAFIFIDLNQEIEVVLKLLISTLSIALLLYLFIYSNILRKLLKRLNYTLGGFGTENSIARRQRLLTLLYSGIRYSIFTAQFILLLQLFEPNISLSDSLLSTMAIYFVTTVIPTAWISDLPVRTSMAFIMIDFMGYDGSAGLIASLVLWAINLFFPALIGLMSFRRINWIDLKKKINVA